DEEANVTGYSYDERGNITRVTQPDGSAYTFNYDEEQRLTLVSDPQGASRTNIYHKKGSSKGLLPTITEADGRISIYRY
ncbi:RHS repeat domain-containing protein, partial [Streptomyces sp. GbtcB7]|uniref:RHS repeat domain-containing protein n=1 Tax=Streptomyces sp. GbtcB7 TaxID=2824752 RepID=UPI001C2F933C